MLTQYYVILAKWTQQKHVFVTGLAFLKNHRHTVLAGLYYILR